MNGDAELAKLLFGVLVGYLRATGMTADEVHAAADEAMRGADAAIGGDAAGWKQFASQVEETIAGQLQPAAAEPELAVELGAELDSPPFTPEHPAELDSHAGRSVDRMLSDGPPKRKPPFGGQPAIGRSPRPAAGRSPRETLPK